MMCQSVVSSWVGTTTVSDHDDDRQEAQAQSGQPTSCNDVFGAQFVEK